MKALKYMEYGGPEVLRWHEVPVQDPAAGEVLVIVKAASLNPTETKVRQGLLRFPGADFFPKSMGMDFAGIVFKTGEGVTDIKAGDKVMGYTGTGGSFADCVIAKASSTFLIPDNMGYDQATTLPFNAATALKVVNKYLKPSTGKTILINGAAGGLGLFIVQFCKLAGAFVTAVAGGDRDSAILKRLGSDQVVDYHTTNIFKIGKKWDVILDTSGKLNFDLAKLLLNDGGEFSTMVPHGDPFKPGRKDGSKQEYLVFAVPGPEEFLECQKIAREGKIQTFVGKTFLMKDAISAIEQFETGKLHVSGKVVLVSNL